MIIFTFPVSLFGSFASATIAIAINSHSQIERGGCSFGERRIVIGNEGPGSMTRGFALRTKGSKQD